MRILVGVWCLSGCTVAAESDPFRDTDDQGGDDDLPPPVASPLDGTWSGGCDGDVTVTYIYTSSTYAYSQHVDVVGDFVLEEDAGGITGVFLYTVRYTTTTDNYDGGYRIAGERNGTSVRLDIVGYTSTSTETQEFPGWFELELAGNRLDGDLVFVDEYGELHTVPCGFERQ